MHNSLPRKHLLQWNLCHDVTASSQIFKLSRRSRAYMPVRITVNGCGRACCVAFIGVQRCASQTGITSTLRVFRKNAAACVKLRLTEMASPQPCEVVQCTIGDSFLINLHFFIEGWNWANPACLFRSTLTYPDHPFTCWHSWSFIIFTSFGYL